MHKFYQLFAPLIFLSPIAMATPVYQPPGANLTLGSSAHLGGVGLNQSNPAAPVASNRLKPSFNLGAGAGLEYGNVDEIFELINAVSDYLGSDGEDIPENPPGDLPDLPTQLPEEVTWRDIVEANPEFQRWFESLQSKASYAGAALAIIAAEAYAKAFVTGDVLVNATDEALGGQLVFSIATQTTSKALGIVDRFDFDMEQALEQIGLARELTSEDPPTTFDLSDDIQLIVDPQNDSFSIEFNNESLLLTKAAKITSFDMGYSRLWKRTSAGELYWGVKPKLLRVGLAQFNFRFGELTDAEDLFNDIKNANFHYSTRLSTDAGALWQANNYSLGISISDPFSPQFEFPGIDKSKYRKQQTIKKLSREFNYTIDTQIRTDYSLYSRAKQYVANVQWDLNPIQDPMGDSYQWLAAGLAYNSQHWAVPSARVGVRKNLAGSGLSYIALGLTFFQWVTLDAATTLETITLDDKTLPRGANISLGFGIPF